MFLVIRTTCQYTLGQKGGVLRGHIKCHGKIHTNVGHMMHILWCPNHAVILRSTEKHDLYRDLKHANSSCIGKETK